jgi:hypothetical protein
VFFYSAVSVIQKGMVFLLVHVAFSGRACIPPHAQSVGSMYSCGEIGLSHTASDGGKQAEPKTEGEKQAVMWQP